MINVKCKDCNSCRKGFFASKPDSYVCIGVQEPFVIDDINNECTEYSWATLVKSSDVWVKQHPYVGEDGIYVPCEEYVREDCASTYRLVISKEMFVEAYNKWIRSADCDDGK